MTLPRAVRMTIADAQSLGRLRQQPGLEVCASEDALWVRAQRVDDTLDKQLSTLPGQRFTVLEDGQLLPIGSLVPRGYLPQATWQLLASWLQVELAPAALAGSGSRQLTLRIVRGGPLAEANVLLTDLETWHAYSVTAPQVRLDRWTFAANGEGQVVIRGTPLPPTSGARYVERAGIAVPAGWTWQPAVDADVLRDTLRLEPGDLALLHQDASWDLVRSEDFVQATRSAVRLSREACRP